MKAIRVLNDYRASDQYIDFEILDENGDGDGNLYRYYGGETGFTKIWGIRSNWSKAIRGNARKTVNEFVKIVYDNNMTFCIIM